MQLSIKKHSFLNKLISSKKTDVDFCQIVQTKRYEGKSKNEVCLEDKGEEERTGKPTLSL